MSNEITEVNEPVVHSLKTQEEIRAAINLFISLDKDNRNLARRLITPEQFESELDYALQLFIERASYKEDEEEKNANEPNNGIL